VTPLTTSEFLAEPGAAILETTIATVLRHAAANAPTATALVDGVADPAQRRRWTYSDLLDRAERTAGVLLERLVPGERLALWSATVPEAWIVTYAAALAGLVLVPVNPGLRRHELEHVLSSSGAAGVVVGAPYRGNDLQAVLATALAALPDVRETISLAGLTAPADRTPKPAEFPTVAPDDIAQIVYTSGTTGTPKGAALTHRGITNAGRFGAHRFGMRPGDVYVDPLPTYHVGGQVVGVSIAQRQASMVVVGAFDAGLVLDLIESEQATLTVAVPTVLLDLLEHPAFDPARLGSLRTVSSGGSVVPPELVRRVRRLLDASVTIVFGQTECCGYIAQTHLDDTPEDVAETLGQPLPGVDVRIADPETGAVMPIGESGELHVRGYNVMAGYYGDPEETARAFTRDGWLRTGDLATLDERGYLRIVGRLKDMIVTGATNVYPAEVEAVLRAHADVGDVAVVGLPDKRWGERVVAVVRPAADRTPSPADLEAFARERLAPYKVPKEWIFLDQLPLTPSGKVQKHVLRDQLGGPHRVALEP
jgi:fatty-acyl-CoA synthase